MQIQQESYVTWKGMEVCVSVGVHDKTDATNYATGWFELYDVESGAEEYYAEGGLWFEEDGITLCDYDGVYALPQPVCDLLRELGFDPSYAED